MKEPIITVIGSINMDLVTSSDRIPDQGETIMGESFFNNPGGKGANQAVACARLGAQVNMLGCVGVDPFGQVLVDNLSKEKIITQNVEPVTDKHTGVATILIKDNDNRIIVTPGANYCVTPTYIQQYLDVIDQSDVVLLQLEIPLNTIEYVTDYCSDKGIPVILNPAPAQLLSASILENCTYLTPNETEKLEITSDVDTYKEKMIVTLGDKGVEYCSDGNLKTVTGYRVNPIDTTGAGDTFNGALAVQLSKGRKLKEAITFANAAAAFSIQKRGAQQGMPTMREVIDFMEGATSS
ncbi:ribokinase [Gracilibacillus salitolerans]|uniref:Ribokinase n=1 Tax=Gracilibacillus salitolerans TaxID=2663022 RepID=A0A5Q2TQY1_9BACI|nr:ribokinase [Gracilibacillus salitolerans]QGH36130.1 ribokinase [Gracilibacillus salitolerans]